MWKVFGEEGVMVQFELLWTERMKDLSKRRKNRDRFLKLLDQADISHYLDVHQQLHVFTMKLPSICTADDVEFLKNFIQRIIKSVEYPMVDLDGEEQRAALIITAEEPGDEHEAYRAEWERMKKEMDEKRVEQA
ncbi:MAG: hypothetical protein MIO90_07230 [Methanomassiliicoccales archaeon]|nr:hypothetical protein [Methanomassiliicoccales archaeon]